MENGRTTSRSALESLHCGQRRQTRSLILNESAMRNVSCHLLRQVFLAMMLLMPLQATLAQGTTSLDAARLAPLADGDANSRLHVIAQLGLSSDPAAIRILEALASEQLLATPEGEILIPTDDGGVWDPLTRSERAAPNDVALVAVNNRLRRAVNGALAAARLFSDDPQARLAAAKRLQQSADASTLPVLLKARSSEKDGEVRRAVDIALATLELKSDDAARRKVAADVLGSSNNGEF